jgi:cytoskeletal protein CcmA (bactofilin family)
MPPAKAALKLESTNIAPSSDDARRIAPAPALPGRIPQRLPNALAGTDHAKATPRPLGMPISVPSARPRRDNAANFQARVPVITGEAIYRGSMPVDGTISGQLGAVSTLTVKQRPRNGLTESVPELDGELTFKDMLRVNGYIAGKVTSQSGTLIVDLSARVDADIEVGIAVISGIVNGDVIAHERVELGRAAIINGNISTRSLTMKPGAVFQGDCRMLKNDNGEK